MQLQELLLKNCEKNKLNKNSVIYDIENAKINDIKILVFNEKNKNIYIKFSRNKT